MRKKIRLRGTKTEKEWKNKAVGKRYREKRKKETEIWERKLRRRGQRRAVRKGDKMGRRRIIGGWKTDEQARNKEIKWCENMR